MRRTAISLCLLMLVGAGAGVGCGDSGDDGDGDDGAHGGENPSEVGNSCETADDCETDRCYTGGPGDGYCTEECENEGSSENCPPDTVCKPIQGGPARCLLVCGSDSACDDQEDCGDEFCPGSSSCVPVSETDHAACEPDPT